MAFQGVTDWNKVIEISEKRGFFDTLRLVEIADTNGIKYHCIQDMAVFDMAGGVPCGVTVIDDSIASVIGRWCNGAGMVDYVPKPLRLYWLAAVMDYLSIEDYSKLLGNIWNGAEYPNRDKKLISLYISMFQRADKPTLMNADYEYYQRLPDLFPVYRGCSFYTRGKSNPWGLSWTLDLQTAFRFADIGIKKGVFGCVYRAVVRKENILAFFNGRNEKEIILDTSAVYGSWECL